MRDLEIRGANLEMMGSWELEQLLSGPAGTGKTIANLQRLHVTMLKYPKARGLILRKTRSSLTNSSLVTFETKVLPETSSLLSSDLRRENRTSYVYPNKSEIVIGGMDSPTRLFSSEYDVIYVNELPELTLDEYESLLRALRNGRTPKPLLLSDANPDAPTHWILGRSVSGKLRMRSSTHKDNPAYWDIYNSMWTPQGSAYIEVLQGMTGVRRDRLLEGKWVSAEGSVYEWDPSVHLVFDHEVDHSRFVRRIVGIDFGYTNPTVVQWWGVDDDNRMTMYREIYITQRLVSDIGEKIKSFEDFDQVEAFVADHDAEARATLEAVLERPITPAVKSLTVGIEKVQKRLKRLGDGTVGLRLVRGALVEVDDNLVTTKRPTCTAEEFPGYVYPSNMSGKPIGEAPVKLHDHGLDTTRYVVMYVDGTPRRTIRIRSFGG